MNQSFKVTRFWIPDGVNIQVQDFLPDPTNLFGDKRLITFNKIQNVPCLVLLGNPGIGKSSTIPQIVDEMVNSGELCIFQDFRNYSKFEVLVNQIVNDANYQQWISNATNQTLHLFLDSLDEGRLEMKRLEHDLKRFLQDIPTNRLCLRITCRPAELPTDFVGLMKEIWPDSGMSDKPVQIYHLAQLRRQDAYQIAHEYGVDVEKFLATVHDLQIEPFASHPITLIKMLLPIYSNQNQLPDDRTEIYKQGCLELAKEFSQSRQDDKHIGEFSGQERILAAEQLATLSILGNYPRITASYLLDNEMLSTEQAYLMNHYQELPSAKEKLFTETINTALFTLRDANSRIWSHRSYAEYLTAQFLTNVEMSLKQIQSLFINAYDPEQNISPKLQETVVWLASMRPDVFEWILRVDPLILIHSATVRLDPKEKRRLVAYFLDLYSNQEIIEDRLYGRDFQHLNYPELGDQVKPFLENKNLPLQVRMLAMDFVSRCDLSSLDDSLINLALDKNEEISLRKAALYCLRYGNHQVNSVELLRSLVADPEKYEVNEEIYGLVLDLLWPQHMSAQELFDFIPVIIPEEDDFVTHGFFNHFITDIPNIVKHLDDNGLVIGLDWIAKQQFKDHEVVLSSLEFVMEIMRRAWDNLDQETVRFAFAKAVWSRLTQYGKVIDSSEYSWLYEETKRDFHAELIQDTQKRRLILQTMLEVLRPETLRDEEIFYFMRYGVQRLPFIIAEDAEWFLEQAQVNAARPHAYAYAYLLEQFFIPENRQLVEKIYRACISKTNPALSERFGQRFEAISPASLYAKDLKQRLASERDFKRRNIEAHLAEQNTSIKDMIITCLDACQKDSVNWRWLSSWLKVDEYKRHGNTVDVRKGYGWRLIQDDLEILTQVITFSLQYIKEQHPFVENLESDISKDDFALAGYTALILLSVFNLLDHLTPEDWQKWATVVVFNASRKDKDTELADDQLLQKAFQYATESIFDHLIQQLDSNQFDKQINDVNYHLRSLFNRFNYASSNEIANLLLKQLNHLPPQNPQYMAILEHLLKLNVSASQEAQNIALAHFINLSQDKENENLCLQIIRVFSNYAQNGLWWNTIWQSLIKDRTFAEKALNIISDRFDRPPNHSIFVYFSEGELYRLYLFVIGIYRFEDDIEFHGGTVPVRHEQQKWRDGILSHLASRGSRQSVEHLMDLYKNIPNIPDIQYLIERAKANFRELSWIAPKPSTIRQLVNDTVRRFVQSSDQLLYLLLETLQQIEAEVQGNAAYQRAIWDRQRENSSFYPVEEEAFSDAIATWLRTKLTRILVNREVEVRRRTDRPRGERTDIIVQALNDNDELLTVIIEVKGCWYRNIYKNMQTQLVDQYLAHNSDCSHGIYLVGYFSSEDYSKCANRDKETLLSQLNIQANNLIKSKPITVEPFVFSTLLE